MTRTYNLFVCFISQVNINLIKIFLHKSLLSIVSELILITIVKNLFKSDRISVNWLDSIE